MAIIDNEQKTERTYMKQKSLAKLQKQVDEFNSIYAEGSKVNIKRDSGEIQSVTVAHKASILGGHSAVGWFEEISGCFSLDRIQS